MSPLAVDDHANLGAAGVAGYHLGPTTSECHGNESVRGSPGWEIHPAGNWGCEMSQGAKDS